MGNVDHILSAFLNRAVGHSNFLDRTLEMLSSAFSIGTIPLLACIWYLWFCDDRDMNGKQELMLREFFGICLAGPLSRILQLALPFHPRPFFTPDAHIRIADQIITNGFGHWNSLPSDHAAVYGAMAVAISYHSRKLAIPAWLVVAVTTLSRLALGIHWPSDVLAGILIGFACVWLCRHFLPAGPIHTLTRAQLRRPGLFFGSAFFICYEVGTLFDDIRRFGTGLQIVFKHVL